MKAIAVVPHTSNLSLIDRQEPQVSAPDEIKLRVLRVGICGTDRDEATGGSAKAPPGKEKLVLGHEMFGQVVEVGEAVTRVQAGDYAVFTVRRGCGKCLPCGMNRSDMCRTGDYRERGILGLDGFQTEFVVDTEQYVVRVPPGLEPIGVLTEPLSIVEKAIHQILEVQEARLPDSAAQIDRLHNRRCLVAGLGPIGLLAAMVLRLHGAQVYGLDIVDEGSARPRWFKHIGGKYIDGREVKTKNLDEKVGPMDLLFEAAGVAKLEFNLLDALDLNGAYVLTGVPRGDHPLEIPGADLIRHLVLKNQVMLGSVNAARTHFQLAVDDLQHAQRVWGKHIENLITHRFAPDDYKTAFHHHPSEEIKGVVEWDHHEG